MMTALRPWWPLVGLLVSASLLAGAHGFETFGHMAPCAMCLQQRVVHWWIAGGALALLVAVRLRPGLARIAAVILGVAFLVSVYFAGRHVLVEMHILPETCDVTPTTAESLRFDVNAPLVLPHCDKPAWSMFGITMAGYNGLISLATALASFVIAFAPARKAAPQKAAT